MLLGAIAGLTIFIGLPMGRVHDVGQSFKAFLSATATGILLFLLIRSRRVPLLQPQRTPIWATVPPGALMGRRTFHRGSVPDAGSPWRRPPNPWG